MCIFSLYFISILFWTFYWSGVALREYRVPAYNPFMAPYERYVRRGIAQGFLDPTGINLEVGLCNAKTGCKMNARQGYAQLMNKTDSETMYILCDHEEALRAQSKVKLPCCCPYNKMLFPDYMNEDHFQNALKRLKALSR